MSIGHVKSVFAVDASAQMVTRAVHRVFQTMLSLKIKLDEARSLDNRRNVSSTLSPSAPRNMLIVGNVGFVGKLTGMVYLYLDLTFADDIASRMLGLPLDEIDEQEMLNDVIGELTNMIVGDFKNQLDELGYGCRLTIPTILRGYNFDVEPVLSATRRIFYFSTDSDQKLIFDLLVQPAE